MKAKSTLYDLLSAQAIRLRWLQAMNECRRDNLMVGFMNAQLNFLYWDDEVGRLLGNHIGEMMDLVRLARGQDD